MDQDREKQPVAGEEETEDRVKAMQARAMRLLHALNQAAMAIERALTPEAIFSSLAEELSKLAFHCVVFVKEQVEEGQIRLIPRYMSYESAAVKAAEKLAGLKAETFAIPVDALPMLALAVRERQAVFSENVENTARLLLPPPLKRFARQIVSLLGAPKSINVPLVVDDDVIGVLSVQAEDLVASDIPTISALANQVATAWRRAQLFEQAQQEIAERVRIEAALRESEERFRNVFQNSPMGIYRTTPNGHILMANPALVAMLGYASCEELAQRNLESEGYHPSYPRSDFKRRVERAGDVVRIESAWTRKDGSTLFVREHARAIRDEQGNVLYYEGTVEDVTERVQIETTRARADRLLESLNRAALAMEKALTPGEIFDVLAQELRKLGLSSMVLLLGESNDTLSVKYVSLDNAALRAAEQLVGLKRETFSIPVGNVDAYREVIRGRHAVFIADGEEPMRQVLPAPARKFAGQLVRITELWSAIAAPLIVEDEVIGLLSVHSDDLTEDDAPTMEAFAHQVAAAWHKAQLLQQARQEIVERKQVEKALRESQELLHSVIETDPNCVFVKDKIGTYILANKAIAELYGTTPDRMVGRTDLDFADAFRLSPDEAEQFIADDREVIATKRPRFVPEESFSLPDGTTRWFQTTKVPLALRDDPDCMLGVAVDITERKRAEEEREWLMEQIQEQAQQVRQIISTVPEGVLLMDTDTPGAADVDRGRSPLQRRHSDGAPSPPQRRHSDGAPSGRRSGSTPAASGRVLLANPAAEDYLGILSGAAVGDTLTHLGDRPLAELLTSPPQGLWHEVAAQNCRFEVIARSIETGPRPGTWVLVLRDVTRERVIEQRSRQQERLATVGQLAAGIAHDFNNIMATIVLYAQMSARDKQLPARHRERMATINQQAKHATRLIQQILDFSRRSVLEQQPLDLSPLLKEQVKLLERTLPENIRIRLAYGTDEYTINADPTSIQQVMMNLALNARDAMPQGGDLRIGLNRIHVEGPKSAPLPELAANCPNSTGEWVQLTVSDTGTGIPPDVRPHIFDPFFTTKAPGAGTGLGLAQVYGIVAQHEGHIHVESQVAAHSDEDGGTTFTIYMPALPVHPTEPLPHELPPLPSGQGETILVVEDNASTRRALVDSLELLNYRVVEATNGQEALAIIEQGGDEIALVLSDVVMPIMGGIALLHALRERGAEVGVVMLTGHPMEKEMDSLRACGMIDWAPKPPSLERLAEVVADGLDQRGTKDSR